MALPARESLATMREDVKGDLGFGGAGSAYTDNNNLIDGWLERAQRWIYWRHDFTELTTIETITSQQGQEGYDWPANTEPKKINQIWVEDTGNAQWYRMVEGIEAQHYSRVATADQGRPTRYERRDQLDVWRRPDSNLYTFHIEGIKRVGRLTAEADLATINEDLIKMLAIAWGKGHYRHPDAPDIRLFQNQLLRDLKGGDSGNKRFVRASGKRRNFVDKMYNEPEFHENTLDA